VEVRGIANDNYVVDQSINRRTNCVETQEAKDKIEISSEAKNLSATEIGVQRLNEIYNRIDSKFYDSEDVLNKVANKLMQEINK